MAACQKCQEDGLRWIKTEDDRWKLAEPDGETPHFCKITEIPIYMKINGVFVKYSENYIALKQTEYCLQHGLDPFTTEFVKVGEGWEEKLVVQKP